MAILDKVFQAAVNFNASDIHVTPGEPFIIRRLGRLVKMKSAPLAEAQTRQVVFEILTQEQRKRLMDEQQLDFAVDRDALGRFRGSAMLHNNGLSAVFRSIPKTIPTLATLGLPAIVEKVMDNHQGLILVTGATGQGKSTTLASMIDHINSHRAHHILTVEDPIEFVHPIKKGVVNQRQLGMDTHSYGNALKAALREDPDVIMIGELRDLETISLAISAAETGHLVLGTLATASAPKTVDRIIDAYPATEQNQIRTMLSESLRAVITQRLIPDRDKKKMEVATEVLIGTLPMANLIRDGKTFQIPSMMQTAKNVGMQIMDESILALLQDEKIDAHEAQSQANDPKRFQAFVDRAERTAK
ncbi:type IV pilus twitching motility protein PilT [Desulfosarcina ovata]|uniref:Twitching motility protein PilT n=1 Tax=Desulfosarcina ovata subsp. ovata TaxID=2752305 RepID=A0A5K8AC94_9BACT|nr:PilT/PilU family type 4a pilus ATPase [Desulfosarcina ovata]BBO90161.1 twitching motility protein PilT [Desulfosarcina ovata subsp. ovata]